MVTELSVVFSAVALPLTYFPILVVANDPRVHGRGRERPRSKRARLVFLVIILAAAVAAIPLLIATGAG